MLTDSNSFALREMRSPSKREGLRSPTATYVSTRSVPPTRSKLRRESALARTDDGTLASTWNARQRPALTCELACECPSAYQCGRTRVESTPTSPLRPPRRWACCPALG
eukprot:2649285-Pleurochrysis_carterae.AAC.3